MQMIAAAVLLEIVLRIYNPVPIRVRGNEIVLPVKQVYTFDNGFTHKIDRTTVHTKNALGFRGPDPPADFAGRHSTLRLEVVSCPRKATLFITRSMANR